MIESSGTGTSGNQPFCSVREENTGTNPEALQKSPPKKKRKSQKERLKAQLAKAREGRGSSAAEVSSHGGPQPPAGAKGKGRGPKRDGRGRFLTDRQGKPICFGFNNGECKGVCPKGMTHVCQVCLGSHPAKDCGKGGST